MQPGKAPEISQQYLTQTLNPSPWHCCSYHEALINQALSTESGESTPIKRIFIGTSF